MGKLDGKVAFITGAARGQGRSHALTLAAEGADIIAIDICSQVESVAIPMATPEDLAETVREVEALDRRIVSAQVDVRNPSAMVDIVNEGVATLGRVDIALANAGITAAALEEKDPIAAWQDTIDINLFGVRNTVHAVAQHMIKQGDGGAIVITSSTQGLTGRGGSGTGASDGYVAAKHGVVGLMRSYAHWLAPHNIRVNTIHPTGVETPMIMNEVIGDLVAANPDMGNALQNLLPIPMVQASDISNAVLYLVSDMGRYVTGVTLPVDGGFAAR
jgi:SDR family mycofactocin-dependent oxidoreductase